MHTHFRPLAVPVLALLFCSSTLSAIAADLVAEGARLDKLPGEYAFTEGPAADAEGNVFFTDQPHDRIVRWDADTGTVSDWLKPARRSNGTYFDRTGNLLVCADSSNQLWSITPDRTVSVKVEAYAGKLLNGPNDLWVRPDGGIYFTDPLYARNYWKRDPAMQQPGQYVYFLAPTSGQIKPVATDLRQPNGIIGTPDGTALYVADIGAGQTVVYQIEPDGSLSEKRMFCAMGSDGMTLDEQGNVYLTGRGVTIFNPAGKQIKHIAVPERWTANVTFGGDDRRLLFITASKAIYGLRMNVKGAF